MVEAEEEEGARAEAEADAITEENEETTGAETATTEVTPAHPILDDGAGAMAAATEATAPDTSTRVAEVEEWEEAVEEMEEMGTQMEEDERRQTVMETTLATATAVADAATAAEEVVGAAAIESLGSLHEERSTPIRTNGAANPTTLPRRRRISFAPQLAEVREVERWLPAMKDTAMATVAGDCSGDAAAGSGSGDGTQPAPEALNGAVGSNGAAGSTAMTPRATPARSANPRVLHAAPVEFAVQEKGTRDNACHAPGCKVKIKKEEPRMVQWQKTMGRNGDWRYHVLCVPDEVALTIRQRRPYVYEQLVKAQHAMRAVREKQREEEEQRRREAREQNGIAQYFLRGERK